MPAVLVVVTLVFTVLGLAGWGLARQMDHLIEDLPGYRTNIRATIADVRGAVSTTNRRLRQLLNESKGDGALRALTMPDLPGDRTRMGARSATDAA